WVDVAVGNENTVVVEHDEGRLRVFAGMPSSGIAREEADIVVEGTEPYSEMAWDFDGLDFDGDGFGDLVVGQDARDPSGAVLIFQGPLTASRYVDVDATMTLWGEGPGTDLAGYRLGRAGDTNGDGYEDLVTGAAQHGDGVAYIVRGGRPWEDMWLSAADIRIVHEAPDEDHRFFGAYCSGAGDLDLDGWPEVVVAEGRTDPTDIRIFFGPLEPAGTWSSSDAEVVLHSTPGLRDSRFDAMLGPGDLTADGAPDLVIGSYFHGLEYDGMVYIVPGSGW
ncbi:MAG: integrin alpha, partial [Acidobacteriota bacterium]|nr:integrin alpha [Acidobacteriota bacterium]